MSTVTLNGRTYNKGDTLLITRSIGEIGSAPIGLSVQILFIRDGSIGLYSPNQMVDQWGDLDGEVENRKGWWINKDNLAKCVSGWGGTYEVSVKLEHRGVNLKGKSCRMLAGLDDGTVFVEFEEDVNGCSADGLGKTGHCVAVNTKLLTKKKREKHAQ